MRNTRVGGKTFILVLSLSFTLGGEEKETLGTTEIKDQG